MEYLLAEYRYNDPRRAKHHGEIDPTTLKPGDTFYTRFAGEPADALQLWICRGESNYGITAAIDGSKLEWGLHWSRQFYPNYWDAFAAAVKDAKG